MAGLINVGLTGIKANQSALTTTGNNVTNANTPGYSRQEVLFESNFSQRTGAGYLGSGVSVADIRRLNSEFVNTQLRSDTTLFNAQDTLVSNIKQLDNLLGNDATGLNTALSGFFSAIQGATEDPQSISQRQLVLNSADSLANRFQSIYSRLEGLEQSVNQQFTAAITEVNGLAQGIAELNKSIAGSPGIAQGDDPNNLLDQRDEKLRQLSELVQLQVVQGSSNQVNVLIGNGQSLVLGDQAGQLGLTDDPQNPAKQQIAFLGNKEPQIISSELSGGKLGGLLEFRDNVLNPTFNEMGRIAIGVADQINDQHELGINLDGQLGGLFFEDVNSRERMLGRAVSNANNAPPRDRVLGVEITDVSVLQGQEYILEIEGSADDRYVLKRESDGEIVKQGRFPAGIPAEIELDGFNLFLESGSFQAGDSFLIQPTRTGARDIDTVLDRPEGIALGSPIKAEADLGNTGSGKITQGTMLDVKSPLTNQVLPAFSQEGQLTPPLAIRFTSETTYEVLDYSDPSNPKPLQPPLNNEHYQAGVTNTVFTDDPGQRIATMAGGGATVTTSPEAIGAGPGVPQNGYTAQTISIRNRDPETGITTTQTVNLSPPENSAKSIASKLGVVDGVQATAYTKVRLDTFQNNAPGTFSTLNITVGGNTAEARTIAVTPTGDFSADELEKALRADPNFESLGLEISNDGNGLNLLSATGEDISIGLTGGGGDQLNVTKINPYGTNPASQTLNDDEEITLGGVVDLKLADGVSMSADATGNVFAQSPQSDSSYLGFQFELSGVPETGDVFTINYNDDGSADNRNGLAMSELALKKTLGNGKNTFGDAYAGVVETVGSRTNRAQLDQESSQTLLTQSENQWQETSGVSLDEEAGKLVQYQAAYNASAQVVSIARDLFNTLIGTFS
ncbi:flagellar hook-associated protein FlgK [Marinobacteraceae bacterium S3BR75-40.1]